MKLVRKLVTRPAAPASLGTSALNHELGNYAMKCQPIVVILFLFFPRAFVGELLGAFGETHKIRNCLGRFLFEQAHYDVALRSFKYGISSCRSAHAFSLWTVSSYTSGRCPRHLAAATSLFACAAR